MPRAVAFQTDRDRRPRVFGPPSRRDRWCGSDPRRGVGWRAHPNHRRAVPGNRRAGSLPPRPHPLERHRRSCGRGTTATRAATYGDPARAHGRGDSVHMHPDVDVHARYATDPGRSTVKISRAWATRSARIVGRFRVSVHATRSEVSRLRSSGVGASCRQYAASSPTRSPASSVPSGVEAPEFRARAILARALTGSLGRPLRLRLAPHRPSYPAARPDLAYSSPPCIAWFAETDRSRHASARTPAVEMLWYGDHLDSSV